MLPGRPEQSTLLPEKSCDSDFDLPGPRAGRSFFGVASWAQCSAKHDSAGNQPKSSSRTGSAQSYIDLTAPSEMK